MAEYHVGCGLAGIYAGTILRPGVWKNKSNVTDEALCAVAEYMSGMIRKGDAAYEISWTDKASGKRIVLTCRKEAGKCSTEDGEAGPAEGLGISPVRV